MSRGLEPDRRIALQVWWALIWRSTLISIAITTAFAICLGFIAVLFGMSSERLDSVASAISPVIAVIVYTGVSVEVTRRILRKKFENFKIVILPRED